MLPKGKIYTVLSFFQQDLYSSVIPSARSLQFCHSFSKIFTVLSFLQFHHLYILLRNTYGLGIPPFALLHKCSSAEWNEERAAIAGFAEKIFTCEGHIYKDCSPAFCMSRQGIIDINKGKRIFKRDDELCLATLRSVY